MLNHSKILNFILENYSLSGVLKDLPSYIDKNYLLSTSNGNKYVVKVSSQKTSVEEVRLENAAMAHIHKKKLSFQTPIVLKNKYDKELLDFNNDGSQIYKFRVVSYIEGDLYCDVDINNPDLHHSLGKLIAEITHAFGDFDNLTANRELLWDLANLVKIKPLLRYFVGEQKKTLNRILNNILDNTLPILKKLPQQVIHNDANNTNLIASEVKGNLSCVGLFDFGDMVYTHRICELAIAMAYALMNQEDILKTARSIVDGYRSVYYLLEEEILVLPELIKARLLQSIIISGKSHAQDPENDYLLISVAPAWELLDKLDKLQTNEFIECLG
jgi:Ser/Thr protein kinase RdoA (MazF antagonist)